MISRKAIKQSIKNNPAIWLAFAISLAALLVSIAIILVIAVFFPATAFLGLTIMTFGAIVPLIMVLSPELAKEFISR